MKSLINAAEREIDEMAFDILATQQPAAVDLRFIPLSPKLMPTLAGRRSSREYCRASHGHDRAARPLNFRSISGAWRLP